MAIINLSTSMIWRLCNSRCCCPLQVHLLGYNVINSLRVVVTLIVDRVTHWELTIRHIKALPSAALQCKKHSSHLNGLFMICSLEWCLEFVQLEEKRGNMNHQCFSYVGLFAVGCHNVKTNQLILITYWFCLAINKAGCFGLTANTLLLSCSRCVFTHKLTREQYLWGRVSSLQGIIAQMCSCEEARSKTLTTLLKEKLICMVTCTAELLSAEVYYQQQYIVFVWILLCLTDCEVVSGQNVVSL